MKVIFSGSMMNSSKPKKQETNRVRAEQMKPAQRRQQLMLQAIKVFANKGIGAARHADIAKECHVSVPTVFSYFPTRIRLVEDVLTEVGNFIVSQTFSETANIEDISLRLEKTGDNTITLAQTHPDHMKVWLMWSVHFAPELQDLYEGFEHRVLDQLSELIKEDLINNDSNDDIRDRARVIMGASIFLAKMVFDDVDRYRQKEFIHHVLKTVMANKGSGQASDT